MPLSDLPQSILFTIFLLLFVLIGIYPTWKKTAALLRKALGNLNQSQDIDHLQATNEMADYHAEQHLITQLDDFEIFVLRRLAQEGTKSLSRRQINAALHLEKPMLKKALESLLKRGLIRIAIGYMSGIRFYLSAAGRNYAIEQGFITSIHEQG